MTHFIQKMLGFIQWIKGNNNKFKLESDVDRFWHHEVDVLQ